MRRERNKPLKDLLQPFWGEGALLIYLRKRVNERIAGEIPYKLSSRLDLTGPIFTVLNGGALLQEFGPPEENEQDL